MKKIFFVLVIIGIFQMPLDAQNINLESSILSDSIHHNVSFQRVEVDSKLINFKYDYKADGRDVFGIILPKIWADSNHCLSGMIIKLGDGGKSDQFDFDLTSVDHLGRFNSLIEIGRLVGKNTIPRDYYGGRWNYSDFSLEFFEVTTHPVTEKLGATDAKYYWLAYHPTHAFVAFGKQDQQFWGFAGTKNLKDFGTFNFFNYQPNGNFWFRSQNGFGEVNQGFFCQNNYVNGTEYLVVPLFYFQHFSPICAKGNYSLRIEGRRTGAIQNYEAITSKRIGEDWFRLAAGVMSEYRNNLRLAPSFEFYKDWKGRHGRFVTEVRYDMLYQAWSIYLTAKY